MIRDTFKVMLQMAMVLTYGAKVPVIKVGRMAGQFAKPRSAPTEVVDGVELPSYRGDIINGSGFTAEARIPDPPKDVAGLYAGRGHAEPDARVFDRWLCGRASGASLDLGLHRREKAEKYRDMRNRIQRHAGFHGRCRVTRDAHTLQTVDFYTSHEALLLEYEEALTPSGFHHRQMAWRVPAT